MAGSPLSPPTWCSHRARIGLVVLAAGLGGRRRRQPPQPARPVHPAAAGHRRPAGRRAGLRRRRADGGGRRVHATSPPQSVGTVFKSEEDSQQRHPADAGRASRPRRDAAPTRGRTSPGSTCCCSAATPATGRDRHPDRHRDPGQHRHQDRRHHAVQPAAQHRPDAVPEGVAAAAATTPTASPTATADNAEYFLNAMYDNVPNTVPKDVLGETDNLGADVHEARRRRGARARGRLLRADQPAGLREDDQRPGRHHGSTSTPTSRSAATPTCGIPPKEFLEPGPNQKLDGRGALWYARGRYGSDDFARMDRQRCVINAIIKQANPANVLARYEDIAKAGKSIVHTDMPAGGAAADGGPQPAGQGRQRPQHRVQARRWTGSSARTPTRPDAPAGEGRAGRDQGGQAVRRSTSRSRPRAAPPRRRSRRDRERGRRDSCAYDPEMAATATPYRG